MNLLYNASINIGNMSVTQLICAKNKEDAKRIAVITFKNERLIPEKIKEKINKDSVNIERVYKNKENIISEEIKI